MLDHALSYLDRGWSVVPVQAGGKTALVKWKDYQERRPTPDEIRQWWTQWPDANIAVITGSISGLIVLDVDGDEGAGSLKDKEIPPTRQARTVKGTHHYYRHPGGYIASGVRFLPGLDLRGDGGYVVAPPSRGRGGKLYEWVITDVLADPPQWLLTVIEQQRSSLRDEINTPSPEQPDWYQEALKGVEEGRRNSTATQLVGRWLGLGLAADETWVLLDWWNNKNAVPLKESELRRTLTSIATREQKKHVEQNIKESTEQKDKDAEKAAIETVRKTDPASACQMASQQLGIEIKQIIRWRKEPPSFTLVLPTMQINVFNLDDITMASRFRRTINSYVSVILPVFKAKEWRPIADLLVRSMEDQDVGAEGTVDGAVLESLLLYLKDQQPCEGEDAEPGRPFWYRGSLYIHAQSWRQHLRRAVGDFDTRQNLAVVMRRLGCTYMMLRHKQDGKWSTERVWMMADGIVRRMKTEAGEEEGE